MFHYEARRDLLKNNSLSLPSKALHFIALDCAPDIAEVFKRFPVSEDNLLVLGKGSNLILPPVLEHYVLHFAKRAPEEVVIKEQSHRDILIRVPAGVIWDDFVRYCVQQNWHGLENLSLIPGSVGAAPIQNIGAYGVEVADHLVSVEVFNVGSRSFETLSPEQCRFAYRDSLFKQNPGRYIIHSVNFRLSKTPDFKLAYGELSALQHQPDLCLDDVRQAVIGARTAKLPDPDVLPNAGSFFKNPVVSASVAEQLSRQYPGLIRYPQADGQEKLAAGWLIERAGWKGYRNEYVGVHDRQALVLINHHHGTQNDVLALAKEIQLSISKMFGLNLDIEPVIISSRSQS